MTVADWAGTLVDWEGGAVEALKQHYCGRHWVGAETRQSGRGLYRWAALVGGAQDGLDAGGRGGLGEALPRSSPLLGRSRWFGRGSAAIGCAAMWPRRSATPTAVLVVDETGLPEEGGAVGRRRPAVFRGGTGRAGRELPGNGEALCVYASYAKGRYGDGGLLGAAGSICRSPGARERLRGKPAGA